MTPKVTHTPGPWHYHEHPSDPSVTARVTNGGWDALCIADVWCSDLDNGANARLIAAAPDTYQECVDVTADLEDAMRHGWDAEHCLRLARRVISLRAAIAKAEGESS